MTKGGTRGSAGPSYPPAAALPCRGWTRRATFSRRRAEKLSGRERAIGVDADDEAARWLAEHDPEAEAGPPKSASKSKTLHRWRQSRGG